MTLQEYIADIQAGKIQITRPLYIEPKLEEVYEENPSNRCMAYHSDRWVCTLSKGHRRSHLAQRHGGEVCVEWPLEAPPVVECGATIRGFICTLHSDHQGRHEAWGGNRICHEWDRDE